VTDHIDSGLVMIHVF